MYLNQNPSLGDHWNINIRIHRNLSIGDREYEWILGVLKMEPRVINLKSLNEFDGIDHRDLDMLLSRHCKTCSPSVNICFTTYKKEVTDVPEHNVTLDSYHCWKRVSCYLFFSKRQDETKVNNKDNSLHVSYETVFDKNKWNVKISQTTYITHLINSKNNQSSDSAEDDRYEGNFKKAVSLSARRFIITLITQLLRMLDWFLSNRLGSDHSELGSTLDVNARQKVFARNLKTLGDIYLLLGDPLNALESFQEARNAARKTNDTLCTASCYESEAAALYLYRWLSSRQIMSTEDASVSDRSPKLEKHNLTNLPIHIMPVQIERLLNESSKRWTLNFSAAAQSNESGLEDFFYEMVFSKRVFVTNAERSFDKKSILWTRKAEQIGPLLLTFILNRLRSSAALYEKLGDHYVTLVVEVILRLARLLRDSFNSIVPCLYMLSLVTEKAPLLDSKTRETMFIGAAAIAFSAGAYRRGAFLLFSAVQLQVERRVTSITLYHLLFSCRFLILEDLMLPDPSSSVTREGLFFFSLTFEWTDYNQSLFHEKKVLKRFSEMLQSNGGDLTRKMNESIGKNSIRVNSYLQEHHSIAWTTTEMLLFKTLFLVYFKLNLWDCAVYVVYAILSKCYSKLDANTQNSLLHLCWYITERQNMTVRLPLLLVIRTPQENSNIICKVRNQLTTSDGKAFESKTQINEAVTVLGALLKNSSHPYPLLCHIRLHAQIKGHWFRKKDQYNAIHWIAETKYSKEPDALALKDNFLEPITKHYNEPNFQYYKNRKFSNHSLKENSPASLQVTNCVWVIGEPIELDLHVKSPLDIPLTIDSIQLLSLGAQFKIEPQRLSLSPKQLNHVVVSIIPISAEPFWILGAIFFCGSLEIPQLCLEGMVEDALSCFSEGQFNQFGQHDAFLKSSSLISGQIIPSMPYLSCHLLTTSSPPDTPHKLDLTSTEATTGFFLHLANSSDQDSIDQICITLLQDSHADVDSLLERLCDPGRSPDDFFVNSSLHVEEQTLDSAQRYFHLNFFSFSDTSSPSVSSLPIDSFKDLKGGTHGVWNYTLLEAQQFLWIHLSLRFNISFPQDALLLIRYLTSSSPGYARYVCIPLQIPCNFDPPLYLLAESLKLTHHKPFQIEQIIYTILCSNEFSDAVTTYFNSFFHKENSFSKAFFFNKNSYSLDFELLNTSNDLLKFYTSEFRYNNGRKVSFTTQHLISCLSCPPLFHQRWSLELIYECSDQNDLSTNNNYSTATYMPGCVVESDHIADIIVEALKHLVYKAKNLYFSPCIVTTKSKPMDSICSFTRDVASLYPDFFQACCEAACIMPYPFSCSWSVTHGITNEQFIINRNEPLHVPCFVPLKITLTLNRHAHEAIGSHDKHHFHQVIERSSYARCLLIPFEVLYLKAGLQRQEWKSLLIQQSNAFSIQDPICNECVWTGSLESLIEWKETTSVTYTLLMTREFVKQTLFFGCLCGDPVMFFWQNSSLTLYSVPS